MGMKIDDHGLTVSNQLEVASKPSIGFKAKAERGV
jgi:hypothetical protein